MPKLDLFLTGHRGLLPNIYSAVPYGAALGFISASILSAIDSFIVAWQIPLSASHARLDQLEMVELVIVSIFFAPLLETLLFQLLVFELVGVNSPTSLRRGKVVSVLLFSCAHLVYGGFEHASRMLVLGGVLSLGYAWARKRSLATAFFLTAIAHTTHNTLIILSLPVS